MDADREQIRGWNKNDKTGKRSSKMNGKHGGKSKEK